MPPLKVLILGAHRLGYQIAQMLHEQGHHVVGQYKSTPPVDAPWPALYCDLTQVDTIPALLDACQGTIGLPDAIINCAAGFERASEPDQPTAPEQLTRLWQLNTLAPIVLTQAFHAINPTGQIIHFLDQRITQPARIGELAYSLSKQSLHDYVMSAAKSYPGYRVNAIAPGAILPPPNPTHREKAGAFLCAKPLPADILRAVTFLLDTPTITGQVLYIDGGQHLL